MIRFWCGLLLAGALSGCAGLAAADGASNDAVLPSPSSSDCPSSGVRLEFGDGDAAMGLRVAGLSMINCGRSPYEVEGWPVVQALDEDMKPLDVRILTDPAAIAGPIDGWDAPASPISLKPGERATSVVVWRNTYQSVSEPPVVVENLQVHPSRGRDGQVLTPAGGLDLGSTGRLAVGPWRAGPPGQR